MNYKSKANVLMANGALLSLAFKAEIMFLSRSAFGLKKMKILALSGVFFFSSANIKSRDQLAY